MKGTDVKLADVRMQVWLDNENDFKPMVYFRGPSLKPAVGVRSSSMRLNDVRRLYDAGLVELVQRRVPGRDEFDYIAVKREKQARVPPEHTFHAHGLIDGRFA